MSSPLGDNPLKASSPEEADAHLEVVQDWASNIMFDAAQAGNREVYNEYRIFDLGIRQMQHILSNLPPWPPS